MNRSVIAFLVAPLWVPLVVAPYAASEMFPYRAQWVWVVIATVTSGIFAYMGVLVFGLPMFLMLRSRNLTALWFAAGIGFLTGSVMWLAFTICFALFLGTGFRTAGVADPGALLGFLISFLPTGLLGMVVGMTLWVIARPDRGSNVPPKRPKLP